MQAIINVKLYEINDNLLAIIKELLSRNVDVIIKKESIKLEEYDRSIPLDKVLKDFSETNYGEEFLRDLKNGFETSTIYTQE